MREFCHFKSCYNQVILIFAPLSSRNGLLMNQVVEDETTATLLMMGT